MAPLQFTPLSSSLSPGFWHTLTDLKLHHLGLDDAPLQLRVDYTTGRTVLDNKSDQSTVGIDGRVQFGEGSILYDTGQDSSTSSSQPNRTSTTSMRGKLINYNTIESFKSSDKSDLLQTVGSDIWRLINDQSAPPVTASDLNPFIMLTFADLKKYKYYYWCGFPALLQKPGWETTGVDGEWPAVDGQILEAITSRRAVSDFSPLAHFALARPGQTGSRGLEFGALDSARTFWANTSSASERLLMYLDPSTHVTATGWPARNVLHYLARTHGVESLTLVALRNDSGGGRQVIVQRSKSGDDENSESDVQPATVGWEKNERGKLAPRMADLGAVMDPARLADQAVDLNLQLMRWRIMPSLDLEKVKQTRCLLLGAGTLGCYVARTLMAWGVRTITFVDSATVSFSNPVRQPLFEFADSLNGGKPKAQAAAEALKRIYPGVNATGISLSIPMPGHPLADERQADQARDALHRLEELFAAHDVVYLLMDSRESRWLPTVLGRVQRKLVMNVALGFDTYLVMRHGVRDNKNEQTDKGETATQSAQPGVPYTGQLGCYYCNDIVAPTDSLTDRTLDQMCTVTRPGLAAIASATAVELMVSVLQHPQGARAPSQIDNNTTGAQDGASPSSSSSPLGIVPHQIRGFLAQFSNLKITGQAYDRCTACSNAVVRAFEQDAFALLKEACDDAEYLERLTGLDQMAREADDLIEGMDELDWSEEEEGELE